MRNLSLCLLVAPALTTACNMDPTRQQSGAAGGAVVVCSGSRLESANGVAADRVASPELARNTAPSKLPVG